MARRLWDAALANRLVRPLRDTAVRPSHLTTVRLAVGLAAAAAFGAGRPPWPLVGSLLFVLGDLLDHADGELARMTGRSSRLGHLYDLASDGLVHVLVLVGIGYGLREGPLGGWALPMGIAAGLGVGAIFVLRFRIEERVGKAASRLPSAGGFEIEDVLYLLPLVAWLGALAPFLAAAVVGAPLFAAWLLLRYAA